MKNQSRASWYALNAIASWLSVASVAFVSFFLSPFIVEHLGTSRYGVWSLTAGLVGHLGLLDLGIRQAVSRYVARHRAVAAHEESSLIISAALRLFGFLGLLAIILATLLAWLTPILFNIPEALDSDVRIIVMLGGLSMAISLVTGVFGGVITGLERFDIQCGIEILITAVRAAAIVLALYAGHGLVALAVIQLATSLLGCVSYWIATHKLYPQVRISWRGMLGSQIRTILAFSASLTVLYALGRIIYFSDTAIIGAFLPIDSVTFYVIAGSLCLYAKEMPRSLSYLMTPRVSAMTSVGSARVGDTIVEVSRISTLIAASIALTFAIRGESFISLWMGHAFGSLSGEVLRILSIAVLVDASRSVVTHSLTGMAKQNTLIPGVALEAACNLAFSIALVQFFGIVGVAWGAVLPGVLVSLLYVPRCLARVTSIKVGHFFRKAVLVPTLACLPFALASVAIEKWIAATNLVVFFLQVLLILPLIPLAAWFICLTPAERAHGKVQIGNLLKR